MLFEQLDIFQKLDVEKINELATWLVGGVTLSLALNLFLFLLLLIFMVKFISTNRKFKDFFENWKNQSGDLGTQINQSITPSINTVNTSLQTLQASLVERLENLKGEHQVKMLEQLGQIREKVARDLQVGRKETSETMGQVTQSLMERFEKLQQSNEKKLEDIRKSVETKLSESIEKGGAVFRDMTKQIGDLKITNQKIVEISKDINSLSDILSSPKLRGNFGEFELENMLRQVVPAEHYDVQVDLGQVRVDAVIRLKEGFLCIDSKFPLDHFRQALDGDNTEEEKASLLKKFHASVKKHVDDIGTKYILPDKTLDFAFMFIPAENVYYEILLNQDVHNYALSKRVIPVSPNTLYATLQALAIGFRGLKIEQEAKRIEEILLGLKVNFDRFKDHFRKIGKHIDNARTQFADAEKDVDKFDDTIGQLKLGHTTPPASIPDNSNGDGQDQAQSIEDGTSTPTETEQPTP